jgi:hypothetical protein
MLTMAEIEYTLSDLMKFSSHKEPIEFKSAFDQLITQKIEQEIDNRKVEIAQHMFNPSMDIDPEDTTDD